jgi:hypothetical protein
MKNRRSRQVVFRQVQYKLALRLVLHWTMFVVAFAALSQLWRLLQSGGSLPLSESLARLALDAAMLGVLLVCLLPYFVYDSLKLSNRFAGPMLRLHRAIRALSQGETVAPVRFRQGDFWPEVAEDFNGMVNRWGANRDGTPEPLEPTAQSGSGLPLVSGAKAIRTKPKT